MSIKHPKEHKSRLGGLSHIYFDMCEQEYSHTIYLEELLAKETCEIEQMAIESQQMQAGIKSIIFAALCVESAINDYAGWQLGDNYFENHLKNLDVLSKWMVIPKLVCGHTIKKSGAAYSALKNLIRSRNELVHNKSKEFSFRDPKLTETLEKNNKRFNFSVENSYKALVLLSLETEALLGPAYTPLKTFDKEINLALEIPDNLKQLVNDCRQIIRKNHT